MSDSDEDYMSEKFLNPVKDKRPGLVSRNGARERAIAAAARAKNSESKKKQVPRKVLESKHREEGLKAELGMENKGFALLQKMGYKPGTALGKGGAGIKVPIGVELKTGRGGLGHAAQKREQDERRKKHREHILLHRRRTEAGRQQEFRQRQQHQMENRAAERDLNKSQGACEQLDEKAGITEPAEPFFWTRQRVQAIKEAARKSEEDDSCEDDGGSAAAGEDYASRVVDLPDEREEDEVEQEEDEDEDDLQAHEKLEVLTVYLRSRYYYCVWCGTSYDDRSDLEAHCPGDTADAHD